MSSEDAPIMLKNPVESKPSRERTWREMRILWHSVAPYIQSGYGTVTKYFMKGLLNKGFVGFVSAYYGIQPGGLVNWNGIYVLPNQVSSGDPLGFNTALEHYKRFQCDLGIYHADFWASLNFAKKIPYTLCYCYDEGTEVLTNLGWKKIKDLKGTEKVATLKRNRLEYQKPMELLAFYYNGKMYRLENRNIDLLVTPNHFLFIKMEGDFSSSRKWQLVKAEEAFGIRKKFKKDCKPAIERKFKGSRRYPKEILGYPLEKFLKLLGWYISEGSTWGDQVVLSQSKKVNPQYCKEIEELLTSMGLPFKYYPRSNQYFFKEPRLARYFRRVVGCTNKSKRIPRKFLNLPRKELSLLALTLRKGDGEKARNRYSTQSKQLADDIQELNFKLGHASNIRSNNLYSLEVLKNGEVWDRHRTYGKGKNTKEEFVDFRGYVYCVRVPNQIIYVRRNGKAFWCSNSPIDHEQYPEKWLNVLKAYKWVAVPSLHAQKELKKNGIEAAFVPHGVNTKVFFPQDKTTCRKAFTIEKEKFVIGIVAANKDEECFDELTEILTRDGWKNYKEISENDFFATLNEKGELEYQKPLRTVTYSGKRKMHLLQTKFLDFCTTLGHEHYVQAFNNKVQGGRTSFRKETSAEIFGKRRCFKKTAIWKGEEVKYFYLPSYKRKWTNSERYYYKPELKIKMDTFLKLVGYYLSEGSCNRDTVFISQKEGRKKKEMLRDLRNLPFKIGTGNGKLWINDVQLASYMKTLGTSAREKRLPRELLNLSSRQLRILWNAIVKGDGWKHCNSEACSTTSKELADQLQELLLKIGAWGTIIKRKMTQGTIGERTITPHSQYIYIIRRNFLEAVENRPSRSGKTFLEKIIDYTGNIWCVEVPNHLVYVRRNGKTMWSGQTRKAWDANFLAIKYFLEQNPDAEKDITVLIHTNPLEERGRNLLELAKQIGINKHIIWNDTYTSSLLTLPEPSMAKLYNCFDVFLLLSRREGFCIPALEAQACGVPCILNDFSALSERNDYGRCGWLVKPAVLTYSPLNAITSIPDPHKGADALAEAYNNESKRKMFSKRALAYAQKQTWDIAIDKYMMPLLERIGEEIPALTSKKEARKIAGNA